MRAWCRTLLVQDNEKPVNIMLKMQKKRQFLIDILMDRSILCWLIKNGLQSISSWIDIKSVWKSWKKSEMQLFANMKLVQNIYCTYIWPPKEVANWRKGEMPLCSRTHWSFESLVDQTSESLCWRLRFCAHLATSNEIFWHNR